MIITIRKDDGTVTYDTNMIADDNSKGNANTTISKIGTLNVIVEALNFASQSHQSNLELLLQNSEEAVIDTPEEMMVEQEVVEETTEGDTIDEDV